MARFATGKTHYRSPVPTSRDQARLRGPRRRSREQRCCSMVSISVIAVRGGGGGFESRRSSIISISVGTGRGCGACTGMVATKRLNNASRSPIPTEGIVTAATTWSAGLHAGSFTVYTGRALSGVGFTILRLSASAWLSHTTPVNNVPNRCPRWNTIEMTLQSTVRVTGDEPVLYQSKSSIRNFKCSTVSSRSACAGV